MNTVCEKNMCTGCNACKMICKKNAIDIIDDIETINAVIDKDKCVNCNACKSVCQVNSKPRFLYPQIWLQGWANDIEQRRKSASGGVASAIAKSFLNDNGLVVTCVFKNGNFVLDLIENEGDFEKVAGSKYVKSNTGDIYRTVEKKLLSGRQVLFIGLPCQVAGILNYIGEKYKENLFTIDLICHGTPSYRLFKQYLKCRGIEVNNVSEISFRKKNRYRLEIESDFLDKEKFIDPYMYSFLSGFSYTENCYSCKYAHDKRISDLTLGDSWGSNLSKEEQLLGISLILCQTEKGKKLLDKSELSLFEVNKINAINNNSQLRHPMKNTVKRSRFFLLFNKKINYLFCVYFADPVICIKQIVKRLLYLCGLY